MPAIIVGIVGCIALIYAIFINISHIHLRQYSTAAKSKGLPRVTAQLSHASLVVITFGPLFLCFSYFHPEKAFNDSACLCRIWFCAAVLSYVCGVYLIKATYFLNVLILQSHLKVDHTHFVLKFSIVSVILMGLYNIVLQIIVLDATCKSNGQLGCDITFPDFSSVFFL